MKRPAGTYITATTLGEAVQAFVPNALPPTGPALSVNTFEAQNRAAELALARLSGVSGLVPSAEYSAIRKEAILTSQIDGTQATLTDLFDEEAGLDVGNADDIEEVTNYLRAYRLVRDNLRDPGGLPTRCRDCWAIWKGSFIPLRPHCRP